MEQEVLFIDYVEGVESIETPMESEYDVLEVVYDLGRMMESVWSTISDEPFNKEHMLEAFTNGLDDS